MARIPLKTIQADAQFQRDCEKAHAKARRAAQRASKRIMSAEEKELERHRKKMVELAQRQRAEPRDIYDKIYAPLEEDAFTRAEQRLGTPAMTEGKDA